MNDLPTPPPPQRRLPALAAVRDLARRAERPRDTMRHLERLIDQVDGLAYELGTGVDYGTGHLADPEGYLAAAEARLAELRSRGDGAEMAAPIAAMIKPASRNQIEAAIRHLVGVFPAGQPSDPQRYCGEMIDTLAWHQVGLAPLAGCVIWTIENSRFLPAIAEILNEAREEQKRWQTALAIVEKRLPPKFAEAEKAIERARQNLAQWRREQDDPPAS